MVMEKLVVHTKSRIGDLSTQLVPRAHPVDSSAHHIPAYRIDQFRELWNRLSLNLAMGSSTCS